jgi:hypothetical protein
MMDPMIASSLAPTSKGIVENLNRFVREVRLQEIKLLKALAIDPDELKCHLEKRRLEQKRSFSDFFLNMNPRPGWIEVHPNVAMTVDDLHQVRLAIVGAKRRLNNWGRRPTMPRPGGLSEHIKWLQESVKVRSQLAQLMTQLGEPEASIRQFYDLKSRRHGHVLAMEESAKIYFQGIPALK